MSMKTFKIVDATQLDTDLASIASALKTKLGSSGNLTFPEDFVTAINSLYYDATPNTSDDISISGNQITVNAGHFASNVTKEIPEGYADINSDNVTITPTITVDASGVIQVSGGVTYTTSANVEPGYIENVVESDIYISCNGSQNLTTATAQTITPTTAEQTAVSANTYTLGEIKVAAIPSDYVDISSITRTASDYTPGTAPTDEFTILAGYYPTDTKVEFLM